MSNINHAFRLDGKVALVTGAARGLGAVTAQVLSQAGAKVMVTDILETDARAIVAGIIEAGGEAAFVAHDVTSEAQWEAAVAAAIAMFGRLDVVVNNAGIETAALITQCKAEDFRRTMDINVTGTFLGMKHAIRAMSRGGASGYGGSIVNISSVAGMIGAVAHSAYCTSKGAVRLLTKTAAVECGRLGIPVRVNSVHPGVIDTEMGANFIKGFCDLGLAPDLEQSRAGVAAMHPMGLVGEPLDVAHAVLFLASSASKWMTGAELAIDGGLVAA